MKKSAISVVKTETKRLNKTSATPPLRSGKPLYRPTPTTPSQPTRRTRRRTTVTPLALRKPCSRYRRQPAAAKPTGRVCYTGPARGACHPYISYTSPEYLVATQYRRFGLVRFDAWRSAARRGALHVFQPQLTLPAPRQAPKYKKLSFTAATRRTVVVRRASRRLLRLAVHRRSKAYFIEAALRPLCRRPLSGITRLRLLQYRPLRSYWLNRRVRFSRRLRVRARRGRFSVLFRRKKLPRRYRRRRSRRKLSRRHSRRKPSRARVQRKRSRRSLRRWRSIKRRHLASPATRFKRVLRRGALLQTGQGAYLRPRKYLAHHTLRLTNKYLTTSLSHRFPAAAVRHRVSRRSIYVLRHSRYLRPDKKLVRYLKRNVRQIVRDARVHCFRLKTLHKNKRSRRAKRQQHKKQVLRRGKALVSQRRKKLVRRRIKKVLRREQRAGLRRGLASSFTLNRNDALRTLADAETANFAGITSYLPLLAQQADSLARLRLHRRTLSFVRAIPADIRRKISVHTPQLRRTPTAFLRLSRVISRRALSKSLPSCYHLLNSGYSLLPTSAEQSLARVARLKNTFTTYGRTELLLAGSYSLRSRRGAPMLYRKRKLGRMRARWRRLRRLRWRKKRWSGRQRFLARNMCRVKHIRWGLRKPIRHVHFHVSTKVGHLRRVRARRAELREQKPFWWMERQKRRDEQRAKRAERPHKRRRRYPLTPAPVTEKHYSYKRVRARQRLIAARYAGNFLRAFAPARTRVKLTNVHTTIWRQPQSSTYWLRRLGCFQLRRWRGIRRFWHPQKKSIRRRVSRSMNTAPSAVLLFRKRLSVLRTWPATAQKVRTQVIKAASLSVDQQVRRLPLLVDDDVIEVKTPIKSKRRQRRRKHSSQPVVGAMSLHTVPTKSPPRKSTKLPVPQTVSTKGLLSRRNKK